MEFVQLLHWCDDSARIWQLVGQVINIIQFAVPVIIILLGTIDLGKAVMAGEDKEIKAAQGMFIRRLIYGVVVFFVVFIVKTVFGLVDTDATTSTCWHCAAKPNGGTCTAAVAALDS